MTKRANPVLGLVSGNRIRKDYSLRSNWPDPTTHYLLPGGEQAEGAGAPGAEAGGGGSQASQAHRHPLDHVASHVTPPPPDPCHVLSRGLCNGFLVQKSLLQRVTFDYWWLKRTLKERERFDDHKVITYQLVTTLHQLRDAQPQSYSFSHSSCRVDRWEKKYPE